MASANETAACERETIERGTPAAELMRRAGVGAAAQIAEMFDDAARGGVRILTGSGNNGGDGWVVAESLARRGYPTFVTEIAEPRSEEARTARDSAVRSGLVQVAEGGGDALVVDALLGTGASGPPRGATADAIAVILQRRAEGASVVSLDLPSGLDATTGAHELCVHANVCLSFGNVKRGHLIARDVCGHIVALDIGLEADEHMSALPLLVDRAWVHSRVPRIPATAHKGTRKRLSVVGGRKGMAGAAILAGEGALRSGIGLLRIVVAEENSIAVHAGIPAAIVQSWPRDSTSLETLVASSDVIAIGPGLGRAPESRDLVERILLAWSGPVVLDADAINVFAGDLSSLAQLLSGRSAVITPHPAELARLLSVETAEVVEARFDVGTLVAAELGAAVLLKGTPTVVFSPRGSRYVSAAGTAALATGGSGDVLTGIVATLLVQMSGDDDPSAEAAACGAFIHGRAAELCRFVRGTTLDDVLRAMPLAWDEETTPNPPGVLARLEATP